MLKNNFKMFIFFIILNVKCNSENLNTFDQELYNSISSPEKAHSKQLAVHSFENAIEEINNFICSQNIQLGLRLLHKHQSLKKGEAMVEIFQHYFHPTATPAYITKPQPIFASNDSYFLNTGEEIFPASWIIVNDEYLVFEYTTDVEAGNVYKYLEKNRYIIDSLRDLINKYNLKSILAPSILSRKDSILSRSKMLIESQYLQYGSVITPMDNLDTNAIQTSWSPIRIDYCNPTNYCKSEYSGNEYRHSIVYSHTWDGQS